MLGIVENLHESFNRDDNFGSIENLLARHEEERLNSINVIVSENRMSDRALAPLNSDIQSRYAASFYSGTKPAQEIIHTTTELAKKVFDASFANISPISGNMSLLAVVFALTKTGDKVGRVPPFFPGGGYPLNYEMFDREPLPLPFSEENWQLDLEKTLEVLQEHKPPLVVLGSSIVTYPMPVKEVAEAVHAYGGIVAYDGSHSLGLIAGHQYQDPLREGADILLGSTHKTFPGPQGGIILTNDQELHHKVEELSNLAPLNGPTLICNPHLARIASTGIVLEETQWDFYAERIVENARIIAKVFREMGVPVQGLDATNYPEFTYCHQVITRFSIKEGIRMRNKLHQHRINVDGFVRIGTSEITRLGFHGDSTKQLANILAHLLTDQEHLMPDMDEQITHLIETYRKVVL